MAQQNLNIKSNFHTALTDVRVLTCFCFKEKLEQMGNQLKNVSEKLDSVLSVTESSQNEGQCLQC